MKTSTPQEEAPLLEINNLKTHFPIRSKIFSRVTGYIYAVDGVTIHINKGETLGLVGESGSGKSTLGKSILRLVEPSSGEIKIQGTDISKLSKSRMFPFRRNVQIVFQDPYSSLNPRIPVGKIVSETMKVHGIASGAEAEEKVQKLFERVGLRASQTLNYANEFSGGQRQRIGIARALALNPKLIIADEPVSALDVSVQAQIINLFMDLQEEFGLSYLFIAHDLAVVAHISHRIAVMYLGKIVEIADKSKLFKNPQHPYTQALLSAIPTPNPEVKARSRELIEGDIPSPRNPPPGCRFHSRCPKVLDQCRVEVPRMTEAQPGHWVACHLC
ncbi:MAG: ATP-binding cassette domain-containing protein [SAR324 cluster bacterium]|nr:ATP-binding cassette domain-containing protein [SAR324 cluster bacterium]